MKEVIGMSIKLSEEKYKELKKLASQEHKKFYSIFENFGKDRQNLANIIDIIMIVLKMDYVLL